MSRIMDEMGNTDKVPQTGVLMSSATDLLPEGDGRKMCVP